MTTPLGDVDYLRVVANSDCRFTGDIRHLRIVARTISMVDAGHWAGASLDSSESDIQIGNETWDGVMCQGSYLLLQRREDRRWFMLTSPGEGADHHCRTIAFAQTAEHSRDHEGPVDVRENIQYATAIQLMLTATL